MEMTIDKCIDIVEDVVAYMASLGSAFPNELYANHKYSEICTAIRTLEKFADKANYTERLKNDLKAILVELQLEIEEKHKKENFMDDWNNGYNTCLVDAYNSIQQKINALKENTDG